MDQYAQTAGRFQTACKQGHQRSGQDWTQRPFKRGNLVGQTGADQDGGKEDQADTDDPFDLFGDGARRNVRHRNGAVDMGLLARGQQNAQNTDAHEGGHHGIGQVPIIELGQCQRHKTGDDLGDAITQLIGGGHGTLAAVVYGLDAPGVDGDILRRAKETDHDGKQRHHAQIVIGVLARNQPQAENDDALCGQHPRAAMAEPFGQKRNVRPVQQRGPDEFQRIGQGRQRKEADHFQ